MIETMPSALRIPGVHTVVVTHQPEPKEPIHLDTSNKQENYGASSFVATSPDSTLCDAEIESQRSQDSQESSDQQQAPCMELSRCFTPGNKSKREATYTMEQVKTHNHAKSAWIVAGNDIYDITDYLEVHPGGAASLLRRAGGAKDCSEDLKFHSRRGQRKWDDFKIGRLVESPEERKNKPKAWWSYWNQ